MDITSALILSVIEGLSEFLPISSTGHLVLASDLLNIAQTDFVKSFEIIIQLGAVLAVVWLYWRQILSNVSLWPKLLIAFLPTAVVGLTLYSLIKNLLLGNTTVTIAALLIGGIVLIVLEKIYAEKSHHLSSIDQVSNKQAFLIGLCQSISVIPGVSRAAATIIGGMFLGLKRQAAVEFSFLLAIPTMFAATGLDLIKSDFNFSPDQYRLLAVGFVGAFITALIAVKLLLKYVQTHNFVAFGVYRIILAVLFWLFIVQ